MREEPGDGGGVEAVLVVAHLVAHHDLAPLGEVPGEGAPSEAVSDWQARIESRIGWQHRIREALEHDRLAQAMGLHYVEITSTEGLEGGINAALAHPGPVLSIAVSPNGKKIISASSGSMLLM